MYNILQFYYPDYIVIIAISCISYLFHMSIHVILFSCFHYHSFVHLLGRIWDHGFACPDLELVTSPSKKDKEYLNGLASNSRIFRDILSLLACSMLHSCTLCFRYVVVLYIFINVLIDSCVPCFCTIWNCVMYSCYMWYQRSKYRISGSYRTGGFHIGYQISGEISGIRAHIERSYWTLL